ncbi:hypothetical protein FKW77_000644 [Venturia effusa]|uniref:Uncharacterized protein n=1 Tax=Venturia effusa TaxID=50376 RepID=A0A517LRH7_9PEZI|nr:hypothetical protein FKW77_000644 [Venturia effusa]
MPSITTSVAIDLIKGDIMYWLTPMDAINIFLTYLNVLIIADMYHDVHPFRCIKLNRKRLLTKIDERYEVIMIAANSRRMLHNTGSVQDMNVAINYLFVTAKDEFIYTSNRSKSHPSTRTVEANRGRISIASFSTRNSMVYEDVNPAGYWFDDRRVLRCRHSRVHHDGVRPL